MYTRRFVNADDLVDSADLRIALESIIKQIIVPAFEGVYTNYQIFGFATEEDNLYYAVGFEVFNKKINYFNTFDDNFTNIFMSIKDKAMDYIKQKMQPSIKHTYLEQVGLSSDQFIIKLVDIKIAANTFVYIDPKKIEYNGLPYYGNFIGQVFVALTLNIEDISGLEPGEIQALQIKYNNLCSSYSTLSMLELREWALQLQLPNNGTKSDLCTAIKTYYGF